MVPIAEDLLLVRRLARTGGIHIAKAYAITSGRRWQSVGMLKTFAINQIILTGCLLGFHPAGWLFCTNRVKRDNGRI